MNILIPDSWLRRFLETDATPKQIKEYLSLCGPSVERVHEKNGEEVVYDVEVTSNRPDSMSILGVAREAAAILPRFGIAAKLIKDPYRNITLRANEVSREESSRLRDVPSGTSLRSNNKHLNIKTDPELNSRWVTVVMDNVTVKPSPDWLQNKLELSGIRALNNVVDITNYFLLAYGQPVHAFDFDEIKPNQQGIPTMILRESKKGEKLTTLDGKTHTLPGGDIVIEDGAGSLIDLCGIMGAENSSVKTSTKAIVLFAQTYDPVHIRQTSMALGHRTEAAALFEKGLDEELVMPTMHDCVEMVNELAGGKVASQIYDIYEEKFQTYSVSTSRHKLDTYLGKKLNEEEIKELLTPLGFETTVSASEVTVQVPSYRRDIEIDVDIVEEIARLYGYHNVQPTLPSTPPPFTLPDKTLQWEEEVKIRLRDWGFIETYTYSMISEELMDIFGLDKKNSYKIANPLSSEWVYMRPTLTPSVLMALKQNIQLKDEVKLFELSMIYKYQPNDLPREEPSLLVVWKGDRFLQAKGLAEALFSLLGIPFPAYYESLSKHQTWYTEKYLKLGAYGALGIVDPGVLSHIGIKETVTRLYLDVSLLIRDAETTKQYIQVPKYPPVIEDMSFVLPNKTAVGEVGAAIKSVSPLIYSVEILNQYEDTTSFRINYLNPAKPLTDGEVIKLRTQVKENIEKKFNAKLKG